MADIISFGMAPAVLTFAWGLSTLGRLGWAAAFLFVTAAALRLARFNIQAASADKRYFVGMPSPAAAGILASTVYAYPEGLVQFRSSLPAILLVVVPALLMVSTVRFRSFKTIDLQARRPFRVLIFFAALLTVIATHPQSVLVVISYGYLVSPLIETIVMRLRRKPAAPPAG
jgi:CDP-diacylglycerol--serine O-phosphatidyltransferase